MLPRLCVVDRNKFQLDLWAWRPNGYKRIRTFPVAVGKQGHRTPHGLYFVRSKSRTPDWQVPSSDDYPTSEWGHIYHFGEPGNPFSGGFVSLSGQESGIGIHGTSFEPRVGTAASHGCIRMHTPDLLAIYSKLAIGTPVYLH